LRSPSSMALARSSAALAMAAALFSSASESFTVGRLRSISREITTLTSAKRRIATTEAPIVSAAISPNAICSLAEMLWYQRRDPLLEAASVPFWADMTSSAWVRLMGVTVRRGMARSGERRERLGTAVVDVEHAGEAGDVEHVAHRRLHAAQREHAV